VVRGDKGEFESVQYRELIPLMLNDVRHQQAALTKLKAQNQMLAPRWCRRVQYSWHGWNEHRAKDSCHPQTKLSR
jgi:hypothetical protein